MISYSSVAFCIGKSKRKQRENRKNVDGYEKQQGILVKTEIGEKKKYIVLKKVQGVSGESVAICRKRWYFDKTKHNRINAE